MSDQTYEATAPATIDGSKLINVGAGSGITQVNGDSTPHQVLAAVAPLGITPGPPGTNTLAVAVFTPVAPGIVPASGGGGANFLRADGTWTAPPGSAGITSINGNGAAAQVIAAGTGISITPGPPGTNTIANTRPDGPNLFRHQNAGVALPDNTLTPVGIGVTVPVASGGRYTVNSHGGVVANAAPGFFIVGILLNGAPLGLDSEVIAPLIGAASDSKGCTSVQALLAPGDIIQTYVTQVTGGPQVASGSLIEIVRVATL